MNTKLGYKKLSEFAFTPERSTPGAVGYDLRAAYSDMVFKHSSMVIRTDLAILLPEGCYGRIAPRSGLAVTHSISIGGGVIDRDYTGDIRVILFNHSDEDVYIKRGTRVAQLICEAALQPDLYELTELPNTIRGNKGFGSSGFM